MYIHVHVVATNNNQFSGVYIQQMMPVYAAQGSPSDVVCGSEECGARASGSVLPHLPWK